MSGFESQIFTTTSKGVLDPSLPPHASDPSDSCRGPKWLHLNMRVTYSPLYSLCFKTRVSVCGVAVSYSNGGDNLSCYPKKLRNHGDQVLSTWSLSASKRCQGPVLLSHLALMQTQPLQLPCTTLGKAGPILFGCSVI